MTIHYGPRPTLMSHNEFRFECPIFKATVKIADCFRLRDMVWRGDKPDVRKGCQSCMRASKCPINNIVMDMCKHDREPYFSAVPVVGKLEQRDLDRIAPIKFLESWIDPLCTPKERELILKAHAEAHPVTRSAEPDREPARTRRSPVKRVSHEPAGKADAMSTVTSPSDMSAVVNRMMREHAA